MARFSGLSSAPGTFEYGPEFRPGTQGFTKLHHTAPWLVASPGFNNTPSRSDSRKRSKRKAKKHRSKSHKKRRKQQIGAYVLQLIGLICLVLAGVKSFEPLTGVGFTLVLIGYKKTSLLAGKSLGHQSIANKSAHDKTGYMEKDKKETRSNHRSKRMGYERGTMETDRRDLNAKNGLGHRSEGLLINY